jgi:hypothetical protein
MSRLRPLRVLAALLALGLTLAVSAASPAGAAAPFTVSLAAAQLGLGPGGTTTLTATSNQDVGQTSFFINIFDATTGTFLAGCGSGTTCTASVTQNVSTMHSYVADIAADKSFPPTAPEAISNTVVVSWMTIHLAASATVLQPGGTTTLTATASMDVSPFAIEIFDTTTGLAVAQCGSGTTCTASVTRGSAFGTYVAYVSDPGSAFPPSGLRAQSPESILVSWLSLSLTATPSSLPAGGTTTLTATASADVTQTPFYIQLFDLYDGIRMIPICKGTTCSINVSQPNPIQRTYIAFVAVVGDTSHTLPPPDLRASSGFVDVTWNPIFVPNLIGDTDLQARSALGVLGLRANGTPTVDCNHLGQVVSQNPSPGTQVAPGSTVSYRVGGPPAAPKTCP